MKPKVGFLKIEKEVDKPLVRLTKINEETKSEMKEEI